MARKRITVTKETPTGRNKGFHDNRTGDDMTQKQFVKEIEKGNYGNFHIRNVNGQKTPVSNPDKTTDNNLG